MTEKETIEMIAAQDGTSGEKSPAFVVFRAFRGKDKGVIAIFPSLNHESGDANYGNVMSYMHVGQHGECEPYGLMGITRPAKPEEYANLKKELESIGYVLTVRTCLQMRWHRERSKRIMVEVEKAIQAAEV